jgi:hypothetical protein
MNKVVAFLEEYAQWVAIGVASLFLFYVVYAYVLTGDQLKVKVGSETVAPGMVDPKINDYVQLHLQPAIETPASGVKLNVKDYAQEFILHMGPGRVPKEAFASAASVRPPIPGVEFQQTTPQDKKVVITQLPVPPTPTWSGAITGDSMVAAPLPIPAEGQEDVASAPQVDPSQLDPETILANALDKKWVMLEGKVDSKALADAWKAVFFVNGKLLNIPPQALLTNFLQLEVVREEQTGPETWGNAVTLKPLPLIYEPQYPKVGDREAEERYRVWAEQHQVDIVEPAFYRILKGDPWYIPSLGAPTDPNLVDATDQPFDPSNPNIPYEKQTPEQRRMVYLYNQEKKAEEQKSRAAERRSKTEATENSRRNSRGGGDSGGSGGRRIGGYAPDPIQLAAGPGAEDVGRNPGRTLRPAMNRTDGRGDAGRSDPRLRVPPDGNGSTRRPARPYNRADMYNRRDNYRDTARGNTDTQLNQDVQIQNPALTGPFDPTRLPIDLKGKVSDFIVWAHDDTVESGKTYRYKMRIKMKNPLYNTFGLTASQEDASKFAVESPWSEWKTVTAPKTTEYFFTAMRQQVGTKNITSVTASVYRHARGDWTKETFTVAPGDAIGGMKGDIDYSTGATLVDLRPDTRERDLRILISDNVGNVTTVNYLAQINDPYYKTLEEKVNKPVLPGDGTQPAAAGNRALINEVGGLR